MANPLRYDVGVARVTAERCAENTLHTINLNKKCAEISMVGRVVILDAPWTNYHCRHAVVTHVTADPEHGLLFLARVTHAHSEPSQRQYLSRGTHTCAYWPIDRLILTEEVLDDD